MFHEQTTDEELEETKTFLVLYYRKDSVPVEFSLVPFPLGSFDPLVTFSRSLSINPIRL